MSVIAPEQQTPAPTPAQQVAAQPAVAPAQPAPPTEQPPAPQTAPVPTPAAPAVVAAPAVTAVPPRIVANRRQLSKRLSSLGFTVTTGGLPYWEVLLFTDPTLIDPANAARRTPANFYSSRQSGGLRKTAFASGDIYLVPSAVVRGFAAAVPKPTEIYYTVAAYATPDGATPVYPTLPQLLPHDAPSVAVSPDFTPDTVDRSGAGFLIVSSEAVGPEDVCRLLEQRPHVKVFAIADGGRDGCLYEMRTNLMLVNELSPASLRHAVFGSNGQPDAGSRKTTGNRR